MRYLLLAMVLAASPAAAQIKIENAWARATAPGAKIAAGYVTIRNAAPNAWATSTSRSACRSAP